MTYEDYCEQFHIQLSEQQKAAVVRTSGQTLLLAVPGSGKTTVVISRVGYLIFCAGVAPQKILTITYSKAAALEMQNRYISIFGPNSRMPKFSTIHSLCVSILRYAKAVHGFYIPDLEPDAGKIVRRSLYEATGIWPFEQTVNRLLQLLSRAQNKMQTETEIKAVKCSELKEQYDKLTFFDFYQLYQNYKKAHHLMDFDDQLTMAYDALQRYPDICDHYHSLYTHIGLDEAQDTSTIQFDILRMIAEKAESLIVVGDDDQSIYGFRGADPQYILSFTYYYPDVQVLYLETNYRSSQDIVGAASRFIKTNRFRYQKNAVAARTSKGVINVIRKPIMDSVYSEVVRIIKDTAAKNTTLAVISRNNYIMLPIVDELERLHIKVKRRDNFHSYFVHPMISGLMGVLGFSVYRSSWDAFYNARSIMRLYLKKDQMEALRKDCEACIDRGEAFDILDLAQTKFPNVSYLQKNIDSVKHTLNRMKEQPPDVALRTAMEQMRGWEKFDMETTNMRISASYPDILVKVAGSYKNIPDFLKAMSAYSEGEDRRHIKSNITLTTIHSAKGLEFERVILLDAFEGVMPAFSPEERTDEEEEEDARLFYVAVTRAKDRVDIYVPQSLYGIPITPSAFIEKLCRDEKQVKKAGHKPEAPDKESPDNILMVGDRVMHKVFKAGVVVNIESNILTVSFDDGTQRRLLSSFCSKI